MDLLEFKKQNAWPRARDIGLRVLLFVVSAIVLLYFCRSGESMAVIAACFAGYVAAATLWVRGQYEASVTTGLWTPPLKTSGTLVGVFLLVAAVGVFSNADPVLIAGVVGTYFCLGYLVMRLRVMPAEKPGNSTRCWLIALAVVTGVTVVGVGFLDRAYVRWLVLAILLLPVVVSVLSERLIRKLAALKSASAAGNRLRNLAVAGAVLLAAGVVSALVRVSDRWMVAAVTILVVLIVALISSTYADIAMVIAVVALLGVTPQQEPGPTKPAEGATSVLVAIGDSYMSGEGAQVFYEGTDNPGNHCRRSPTAWAAMAGQRDPFDGLLFLACSGARTFNVNNVRPPSGGKQPEGQFHGSIKTQLSDYVDQQHDIGFTPSLVVVSLGGNDAGFSTIGAMCLAPGNCQEEGTRLWLPELARVKYQLRATFKQVNETFQSVPVVVVGYPDPIYTKKSPGDEAADCTGVPLSKDDRSFIETLLGGLNRAVRRAAHRSGFYYLDMTDALANSQLQLCDPRNENRPGINLIGLRSVSGIAEERFNPSNWYHNSLHPNERGHAAMLETFETWLSAYLEQEGHKLVLKMPLASHGRTRGGPVPGEQPPISTNEADDQVGCDLYAASGDTPECSGEGYSWVGAQVRNALFCGLWGPIYLAIAAGSWFLAVVFFASRRVEAGNRSHRGGVRQRVPE